MKDVISDVRQTLLERFNETDITKFAEEEVV